MARDTNCSSHSFKKKLGSGNQKKNDQQDFETAPILYVKTREEPNEVTIRVPPGNGETDKKSVLIYNGNTSKETYLQMVNEFSVLLECYQEMQRDGNAAGTINSFRDCLRNAPTKKFNGIITVSTTYQTFVADVRTIITDIMGPTALRDELAYLRRTPKPNSFMAKKWINRIEAINNLLTYFQDGTNERSVEELAKEIIIPNLPHYLRDDFELSYRTGDNLRQMCRTLTLISNKTKKASDAAKKGSSCNNGGNNIIKNG